MPGYVLFPAVAVENYQDAEDVRADVYEQQEGAVHPVHKPPFGHPAGLEIPAEPHASVRRFKPLLCILSLSLSSE